MVRWRIVMFSNFWRQRMNSFGFSGRSSNKQSGISAETYWSQRVTGVIPLKWNTEIIQRTKAILLESIGDMLALWDNGIRILLLPSVDISSKIIQFLIKMDTERSVSGFYFNDSEKWVRQNIACEDSKKQLLSFFDERQIEIGIPEF